MWAPLLLLLLAASDVDAKILYVNNSGTPTCSDSTTYASNSAASPWCSIGRASWGNAVRSSSNTAEAATAGDTVTVTGGTYSHAGISTYVGVGPNRFTPLYGPLNSGTAGNPITFTCTGTCTLTTTSGSGAVFGALNVDYVTWHGFTLDETNAPSATDTGPVVLWSTTGSIIENNIITGDVNYFPGDNHTGIRIENGQSLTIRDNVISYFRNGGDPACVTSCVYSNPVNAACIETYFAGNSYIYNNELHHCGTGVFLKGNGKYDSGLGFHPLGGGAWTVYLNYVHDTTIAGIYSYRREAPADGSGLYIIRQNLLVDVPYSFIVHVFEEGDAAQSEPRNIRIVNNTAVRGTSSILFLGLQPSAGHWFYNNIFSGPATQYVEVQGKTNANFADTARVIMDYNLGNGAGTRWGITDTGGSTTLANWQSNVSQDSHSSNSAPSFAASGSNDYRLCTASNVPVSGCAGASAALTVGLDVLDLDGDSSTVDTIPAGAYITNLETIGVGSSGGGGSTPTGNGTGGMLRFKRFQ